MPDPIRHYIHRVEQHWGMRCFPAAVWEVDANDPQAGYPLLDYEICELAMHQRNCWEHLAYAAHFVTGLRDAYEHSFDSWERKDEADQMIPAVFVVSEASEKLDLTQEEAEQLLLHRTLHTLMPEPLLMFFAHDDLPDYMDEVLNSELQLSLGETWLQEWICSPEFREQFRRTWPGASIAKSYPWPEEEWTQFSFPAPQEAVFDVDDDFTVRCLIGQPPEQSEAMARLLDYALTNHLLSWCEIFQQQSDGSLRFQRSCLPKLRSELEKTDRSRRIGDFEGGHFSDEALRLIMMARLLNLVGPRGLWRTLGLCKSSQTNWQLHLPERYQIKNARFDY